MARNNLTMQDWSVLTLIAETPQAPRQMINQAVRRLDGEAKRVGLEMVKQLNRKRNTKISGRSARTAKDIFYRTQNSGFVKHDEEY